MRMLPSDKVRVLFVVAAAVMVLLYPFFSGAILEPPVLTYAGIIILTVLAAFTTVRDQVLLAIDAIIAGCGLIAFEFYAVNGFTAGGSTFALVNQLLALVFFSALYFSVRGLLLAEDMDGSGAA